MMARSDPPALGVGVASWARAVTRGAAIASGAARASKHARNGDAQSGGALHQFAPIDAATEDTVDEIVDLALQALVYHRYPPSRSSPATPTDDAIASESISRVRSISLAAPA